jgi:LPS-assembly protein
MGCLNKVGKTRWLAGSVACGLAWAVGMGSAALAQSANPPPSPSGPSPEAGTLSRANSHGHASSDAVVSATPKVVAPEDTPADQLMGNRSFYLEADSLIYDPQAHIWTAKGSVESRYQGRTLRADEVVYNQTNGVVTARGHAQLLNADGTSEFAQSMTMDKDFKAGVALAFSTRQPDNAKIAADEAVRLNKDTMELNKAIFTICDLCAPDGTPEEPTWSIQASQVIQDHTRNLIYYKNVVIRVAGLPIIYSPVFWHVDPSAKRGSGLLAPKIAYDSRRGLSYEQPCRPRRTSPSRPRSTPR